MERRGFTLVELLVVVGIIGILAVAGFAGYTVSVQKARDGVRKADLGQVKSALEAYNSDFGRYPRSCSGKIYGCGDGTQECAWGGVWQTSNGKVYMQALPLEQVAGNDYVYLTDSTRKKFQLYARLENSKDDDWVTYTTTCNAGGDSCSFGLTSSNADLTTALVPDACL